MTRGGHREGSGRPSKPDNEKAKTISLVLYPDEIPYIKGIVKRLHEQKRKQQKEPTQ